MERRFKREEKDFTKRSKTLYHGSKIHHAGNEQPPERRGNPALSENDYTELLQHGRAGKDGCQRHHVQRGRNKGNHRPACTTDGPGNGQRQLGEDRRDRHVHALPLAERREGTGGTRRRRSQKKRRKHRGFPHKLPPGQETGSRNRPSLPSGTGREKVCTPRVAIHSGATFGNGKAVSQRPSDHDGERICRNDRPEPHDRQQGTAQMARNEQKRNRNQRKRLAPDLRETIRGGQKEIRLAP